MLLFVFSVLLVLLCVVLYNTYGYGIMVVLQVKRGTFCVLLKKNMVLYLGAKIFGANQKRSAAALMTSKGRQLGGATRHMALTACSCA
jgi:hypothetical protein